MRFNAKEGVARLVEAVYLDGREVTGHCWALDDQEGWVDLYPPDLYRDTSYWWSWDEVPVLRAWGKVFVVFEDYRKARRKWEEEVEPRHRSDLVNYYNRGWDQGFRDGHLRGLSEADDLLVQAVRKDKVN